MNIDHTSRGLEIVPFVDRGQCCCSLQQSSAIDVNQPNAIGRPGGTCIWLGADAARMHLGYDQVRDLVEHLQAWLETGSFVVKAAEAAGGTQ